MGWHGGGHPLVFRKAWVGRVRRTLCGFRPRRSAPVLGRSKVSGLRCLRFRPGRTTIRGLLRDWANPKGLDLVAQGRLARVLEASPPWGLVTQRALANLKGLDPVDSGLAAGVAATPSELGEWA